MNHTKEQNNNIKGNNIMKTKVTKQEIRKIIKEEIDSYVEETVSTPDWA